VEAPNTITAALMVDPSVVLGQTTTCSSAGATRGAKERVSDLPGGLGRSPGAIIDTGDISDARAAETYLALWLHLIQKSGTARLNVEVHVAREAG
jgi:hypothetical protein